MFGKMNMLLSDKGSEFKNRLTTFLRQTWFRPPHFDAKCMPIGDSRNSISREIKSKHRTNATSYDLGEAAGHAIMATTNTIDPDVPELLCKEGLGRSIKRTSPYRANSKTDDGTSILLARRRH